MPKNRKQSTRGLLAVATAAALIGHSACSNGPSNRYAESHGDAYVNVGLYNDDTLVSRHLELSGLEWGIPLQVRDGGKGTFAVAAPRSVARRAERLLAADAAQFGYTHGGHPYPLLANARPMHATDRESEAVPLTDAFDAPSGSPSTHSPAVTAARLVVAHTNLERDDIATISVVRRAARYHPGRISEIAIVAVQEREGEEVWYLVVDGQPIADRWEGIPVPMGRAPGR